MTDPGNLLALLGGELVSAPAIREAHRIEGGAAVVHRVLKPRGAFVLGMIDRTSPLGQRHGRHKEDSASTVTVISTRLMKSPF